MKIGVNTRIYQNANTGIPYYIKLLYKSVINHDTKNEYIFFQTSTNKKIGNTKTFPIFNNNIGNLFFDLFLVIFLIIKNDIEVFHGPANVLPIIKPQKVKYVVTIHDLSFLVIPKIYPTIFRIYYKLIMKRTVNIADLILADSKNTKRDIIKFYSANPKKIKVLYPGINDIYISSKPAARIVKERYFFALSTHGKRKNINILLKLIGKNKDYFTSFKFILAGHMEDKQRQEIEQIICELELQDYVKLTGYITETELLNLYHYADLFIYPSLYEGFGLPVVEAMACKCLVLTSNNSSLTELINDPSLLMNPNDELDILQKIKNILNMEDNVKKSIIEENFLKAHSFQWPRTAKKFTKIINNYSIK